jgi:hypothetical protein
MAKDFNDAINKIMPLVIDNDTSLPFIISRHHGGGDSQWIVEYPYPAEAAGERFMQRRENDSCTVMYKGADFDGGSYSYVHDKILIDILRCDYYEITHTNGDSRALSALINFFEDNVAAFSQETLDYLATLDNPFAELKKMCPFNMATEKEGWLFNESLAADAVDHIENAVYGRLHPPNEKITLTAAHCLDNSTGENFTGRVLIVKADALLPEYQDSESQLVRCTHGNGARPDAIGRSIFCKELASDTKAVYYRNEIEGIADVSKLPDWAKQKLTEQKAEQIPQEPKTPGKKPSLLGKLDDAKEEAAVLNAKQNKTQIAKKRGDMEVG